MDSRDRPGEPQTARAVAVPPSASDEEPERVVPRLLVLTDRERVHRSLRVTVLEVAAAGAPAVLLCEKDLDDDRRRRLGTQLAAVTGGLGTSLVVASDPVLAADVGSGVHLAAGDDPVPDELRAGLLVGRCCTDSEAVTAAVEEGVDYIAVTPVAKSLSTAGGAAPIGPERLAELVAVAGDVPVLALGGVQPRNVSTWLEAGAHGVAVMGEVMGADEPADVVTDLLAELPDDAS